MPLPRLLKKLDRWLLLHKPDIWLTRTHLFAFWALPCTGVVLLLWLLLPAHLVRLLSTVPLFISVSGTIMWLQWQLLLAPAQAVFKRGMLGFAPLYFLSIVALNFAPILFFVLAASGNKLLLPAARPLVTWTVFVLASTILAGLAAIGLGAPYRPVIPTLLMMLYQLGLPLIAALPLILRSLGRIAPTLLILYFASLIPVFIRIPLPRWTVFGAVVLEFILTPIVPFMLLRAYQFRQRDFVHSVDTFELAICGVILALCSSGLLERRLGEISAQPV
jgi:hypothetical protein